MIRSTQSLLLAAIAAPSLLLSSGCGGGGTECGPGTVEDNGQCVPENPLECGDGTVEQDGECVAPSEVAPTVTSIEPAVDLVGGGADFTITGTGFEADGAGTTVVSFGGVAVTATVDSDTEISGVVPTAVAKNVTVTVANDNGSADTSFSYTGIYAASGSFGYAGHLTLLDPRDGFELAIGPLVSASASHAVTAMEFDDSGTLWATESNQGDVFGEVNLLTIDPDTGEVTVVGLLTDTTDLNHCCIADITFSGTTLTGWSRGTDRDTVTIDTATGEVTDLGDNALAGQSFGFGMVTLGDGTVLVAPHGDDGEAMYSVNVGTGAATATGVNLGEGSNLNKSVAALTRFQGAIYGLLKGGNVADFVSIDTSTGAITSLGRLPGAVDALASDDPEAPASAAPVRRPRATAPVQAAPATALTRGGTATIQLFGTQRATLTAAGITERSDTVAVGGKRTSQRGVTLAAAVGDLHGASTIHVVAADADPIAITAGQTDDFLLTVNGRGQLKLVDRTGRTLLRNVIELRAF